MNEEITKLGADALKDLLTNLTQAKGFVLEQAPDFCQQMCTWAIVSSAIGLLLWILASAAAIVLVYRLRSCVDAVGLPLISILIGILAGMFLFASFAAGVLPAATDGLKAYFAPKVYLVEQITHMVK